jgi:hypothetical protein
VYLILSSTAFFKGITKNNKSVANVLHFLEDYVLKSAECPVKAEYDSSGDGENSAV